MSPQFFVLWHKNNFTRQRALFVQRVFFLQSVGGGGLGEGEGLADLRMPAPFFRQSANRLGARPLLVGSRVEERDSRSAASP